MSFITCPNCKRKTDTSYLWRCHYCGAAVADPNEPIGHKKAIAHSDPNQYLKDLEQKVRELEPDAMRYRAWRDGKVIVHHCPSGWEACNSNNPGFETASWHFSDSLDAAIDAAMLEARKK